MIVKYSLLLIAAFVTLPSASKYNLIHELRTWPDAEEYCQTNLGTSLASIFNEQDYNETLNLCQIFGGIGCWIGLSDIQNDGVFAWSDGISMDYVSDLTQSPPWPSHQFQLDFNDNNDCILIRGSAFASVSDINYFCSKSCDDISTYFVCNAPSETCSAQKDNWVLNIYGNISWVNQCQYVTKNNSLNVIANKIFYDPIFLEIEYVFAVNEILNANSITNPNNVGVVLDYYGECHWYFYIGITVNNNNDSMSLFIANVTFGNALRIKHIIPLPNTLLRNTYYKLKIETVNNSMFNIYVNDINYVQNWRYTQDSEYSLTGLIGTKNNNSIITTKSLFVTSDDKPRNLPYIDPLDLSSKQCPNATNTIIDNGLNDFESIFDSDYYLSVIIAFEYEISHNASNETNINNILINKTETFIENEIQNTSCIIQDYIHCIMNNNGNSTFLLINASMIPCDDISEHEIISYFQNDTQQTELIQSLISIISNISDEQNYILNLIPNTTKFNIVISNNAHNSSFITTADHEHDSQIVSDTNVFVVDFNDYYIFLAIGIVVIVAVIIICGLIIIIKLKQTKYNFDDECAEKQRHNQRRYSHLSLEDENEKVKKPKPARHKRKTFISRQEQKYSDSDDSDSVVPFKFKPKANIVENGVQYTAVTRYETDQNDADFEETTTDEDDIKEYSDDSQLNGNSDNDIEELYVNSDANSRIGIEFSPGKLRSNLMRAKMENQKLTKKWIEDDFDGGLESDSVRTLVLDKFVKKQQRKTMRSSMSQRSV